MAQFGVVAVVIGLGGIAAHAIDEQAAIEVVDDSVKVVSEGQWHKFD